MKKLLLASLMMCMAVCVHAAKAYPFPVTVTQSDGTQLTIKLNGDEDIHWTTTLDGVILVREGRDYFVADIDKEGNLKATHQLAHNVGERTPLEKLLIDKQDRTVFLDSAKRIMEKSARRRVPISGSASNHYFPHHGKPKAPVILVEFADSTFSLEEPKKAFDYYLNGVGEPNPNNGEQVLPASVRSYFKLMSNGDFEPSFDIYGPVKLSKKTGDYKNARSTLVKDACMALNDIIDFTQYDSNDDGYIDLVYVIYAGYSASITGNADNCIWPASGADNLGTFDGKTGYRWGVNNELNGFPGAFTSEPYKRINGQGLFMHEFSHTLGLPDFYPTVSASQVDNQGMEFWDLMDGGEYVANGYYPTAYTGWEREAMGWLKVDTLDKAQTNIELAALDMGGKSYRIPNPDDPAGREYFMIETIAQYGWNYYQKDHGLMIYHVNYPNNEVNTGDHPNNTKGAPAMTVIPADGNLLTSYVINKKKNPATGKLYTQTDYYNDLAGDLFPYKGVNSFDSNSNLPNNNWFKGEDKSIKFALSNINYDSETRITTFDFTPDVTLGVEMANIATQLPSSATIYTIDGRVVPSDTPLPKGIYIQNNRKFVVK